MRKDNRGLGGFKADLPIGVFENILCFTFLETPLVICFHRLLATALFCLCQDISKTCFIKLFQNLMLMLHFI